MRTKEFSLKYLNAKNRIERLKRFYTHLVVYIAVNTVISMFKIINNLNHGETIQQALFDLNTIIVWLIWGIALTLHAFSVFGIPFLIKPNWEEQKIEQYMDEELQKIKNK